MDTAVEWVDVRERVPRDGIPVAAATAGRYPPDSEAEPPHAEGEAFWLVMPMYFTTHHIDEDGAHHHNVFVDSDRVIRPPYGGPDDESVTHWAELPTLPGQSVHHMLGEEAETAARDALGLDQRR